MSAGNRTPVQNTFYFTQQFSIYIIGLYHYCQAIITSFLIINMTMRLIIILCIMSLLVACSSEQRYTAQPKSDAKTEQVEPKDIKPEPVPAPKAKPAPRMRESEEAAAYSKPYGKDDREIAAIEKRQQLIVRENWPNKNLERKTDSVLSQLIEQVNVVFKIPEQTQLGDKIKAQLLVDLEKSIEELDKTNPVKGTTVVGTFKTSRVITAKLIAPDFTVTAVEPEEQVLVPGQTATWNWHLTPKDSGVYDVTLTIDAKVEVNSREKSSHVKTFERTVKVTVTPMQIMLAFIENNWQWLWSALLVPVLLWFWNKRKKVKDFV